MPHFFFDLCAPDSFERDAVGLSFESLDVAYLSASQAAMDISIDMLRERKDPSRHRFEVRDGEGRIVLELPFAEVLHPGKCVKPPPTAGQVHARLQASLDRNRKLKADMADLLVNARKGALQGLALLEVKWDVAGKVE